jgi:hypothetical protein
VEDVMNRRFRVRGVSGVETYIELLAEVPGGYDTRIISIVDHTIRESCEYLTRDLLDSCIRTGYLAPVKEPALREAVLSA